MSHQRSSFDRSFSHKTTFNVGDVVPVFCEEVLPGDTFSVDTAKVVRMQTLLAPVFDNMYLDTYYFFVPNRLTWQHWKQFCGENTESAWIPTTNYSVPTISAPSGGFDVGTIADYMGLPVGVEWSATDVNAPIALPFRAYALICDSFFRDENLQDPLVVDVTDANNVGTNSDGLSAPANGGKPFRAAKYHDYFTSSLPSPQKGPAVSLGSAVSGSFPVYAGDIHGKYNIADNGVPVGLAFSHLTGSTVDYSVVGGMGGIDGTSFNFGNYGKVTTTDLIGSQAGRGYGNTFPSNLWTDVNLSGSSFSINELRLAVVTQMYYEALARGGSRYEEQIAQFFGVTNPDSRVQRPEYLGGNRIQLNVHAVTNTAQSEKDFLGDLGAQSVTGDRHSDFTKSFTEHGWVLGLVVARYDHSYCQGIERKWLRKDKFDYYNPLFARIGEQPVYNVEIYADANSLASKTVFGYQEAWASYRYAPNKASGELRPNVSGSLGHWTLTDNYSTQPTLSDTWISEDKTNVDRCLAVTSSLSNQLFGDFYFNFKCVRPMPMYSVPGALGAF